MSPPNDSFSLSDAPKKNIKDALIVVVLAGALTWYLAGPYLDIFMLCLFGSIFLLGIVMLVIGIVRAIFHGLNGEKTPGSGYNFFAHLGHALKKHMTVKDAGGPDVPVWLLATWFIGIFLGPAIGWLVTSNAIGNMTYDNWKTLVVIRLLLTLPIPVGLGFIISVRYLLPYGGNRIAGSMVLALAALAFLASHNSLRDYLRGTVAEKDAVMVAFQRKGYVRAPWLKKAGSVQYGHYRVQTHDGQTIGFACTPICLQYFAPGKKFGTSLMNKPVKIYYLKYLDEILEIEPTEATKQD